MNYRSLPKITGAGGMFFALHDYTSDGSRAMFVREPKKPERQAILLPLCSHYTTCIQACIKLQFDEQVSYRISCIDF